MNQGQSAPEAQSQLPASAHVDAGRFFWCRRVSDIVVVCISLSTAAGAMMARPAGFEISVAEAREGARNLYRDGPPPGFSGGFGEDHCQACHFGDQINLRPGSLTISAPARYAAGETYDVTLTLTRPDMVVGGFQLTARFEYGGAQAGTLSLVTNDTSRMKVSVDRGIQYAYHRRAGTRLTGGDEVRWTLRWTAPSRGGGVLFHAAANAANDDDSQFGDFVYTATARSGR